MENTSVVPENVGDSSEIKESLETECPKETVGVSDLWNNEEIV
jgi:hypothetical protein